MNKAYGYNKWKNQFERHVKKGERGITIIAPTPYKKKIEEQKLDPDTHAPMLDANGRVVMEEKEVEIPLFRPVKVFDVSQTDGKPLPSLAADLFGNVRHFEAFMEALVVVKHFCNTLFEKSSVGSCFKWSSSVIIRMGTGMIVPYKYISA